MDHQNEPAATRRRLRLPLAGKSPRTRSVVVATCLLLLGLTSFAAARTGSPLREGVRNGTTTRETQVISNVASTTGTTGGYSTRQSNLSSSGGGAVYGCRSGAGGSAATPRPQNPCLRANNLASGFAFEFNAANGDTGGLITVGAGGDTKKPFTTNATGVATGLNADEIDGKDSTDLQARFAQVAADGTSGAARGVPTGGVSNPAGAGTYQIVFTGDLSACAMSATITGATPGEVTVTPTVAAGNTTVSVLTFDSAGAAADRAFHLTASC
jgi:hypothetical protein